MYAEADAADYPLPDAGAEGEDAGGGDGATWVCDGVFTEATVWCARGGGAHVRRTHAPAAVCRTHDKLASSDDALPRAALWVAIAREVRARRRPRAGGHARAGAPYRRSTDPSQRKMWRR